MAWLWRGEKRRSWRNGYVIRERNNLAKYLNAAIRRCGESERKPKASVMKAKNFGWRRCTSAAHAGIGCS
jgi:hypothetical protein